MKLFNKCNKFENYKTYYDYIIANKKQVFSAWIGDEMLEIFNTSVDDIMNGTVVIPEDITKEQMDRFVQLFLSGIQYIIVAIADFADILDKYVLEKNEKEPLKNHNFNSAEFLNIKCVNFDVLVKTIKDARINAPVKDGTPKEIEGKNYEETKEYVKKALAGLVEFFQYYLNQLNQTIETITMIRVVGSYKTILKRMHNIKS